MQKLIKLTSALALAISSYSSARAEDGFKEIKEAVQEVIEKRTLEKQEFKPIIYTDIERDSESRSNLKKDDNKKYKQVTFKNEFFQSVKIVLVSKNDFKTVYLNPYEKLEGVVISKTEDYKIKVYDLNEKHLGNLITHNLKKKELIQISPFLIFPELLLSKSTDEDSIIVKEDSSIDEKNDLEELKPITTGQIEPKKIQIPKKINPLKPEPLEKVKEEEQKVGGQFKIANISDYKVKVSIKKANGESIGTNWTIDNDVYSPEALKFASEPVVLEPDTSINITYLDKDDKVKKELSLNAKSIPKDPHNNYTYFIKDITSD